jgi:hypothetical protein
MTERPIITTTSAECDGRTLDDAFPMLSGSRGRGCTGTGGQAPACPPSSTHRDGPGSGDG